MAKVHVLSYSLEEVKAAILLRGMEDTPANVAYVTAIMLEWTAQNEGASRMLDMAADAMEEDKDATPD